METILDISALIFVLLSETLLILTAGYLVYIIGCSSLIAFLTMLFITVWFIVGVGEACIK